MMMGVSLPVATRFGSVMATTLDLPLANAPELPSQLKFVTGTKSFDSPLSSSTTPHDDPLRILVPAQKKLSTIESQRVLAIINETANRLESALVIPSLVKSLEHLSEPLGSDLVGLLQEYRDATAGLPNLLEASSSLLTCTSQGSLRDGNSDSGLIPVGSTEEEKLRHVKKQIRHNVKSILRAISSNPSLLHSMHHKKVLSHTKLMESFRGLCSVSNEMLLTTRMEEVKRSEHLQLVASRRLAMEESIRKLENELAIALSQKDQEVSEKKAQIQQLQSNIASVSSAAQDTARKVRSEAKRQQTQAENSHSTAKTKLEEEIGSLKKQLQDSVAEDREREQETRKKTFKRELEVDNWIKKYDEEMGEKQDELEMLEEQFTEEKRQLKELDEKLEVLKLKYDSAIKEQEEARLKAEQEAEERERRTRAASMIQRCWRAHHKRKMEAKQAQKGKKKGKGKGKGKKKA